MNKWIYVCFKGWSFALLHFFVWPAKPVADELYCSRQIPASSNLLSVFDTAEKETSDKRGGIDEGGREKHSQQK